jgi:aminomethyltransferase
MPKTTPFHARLAPLNQTGIWKNWSGYLVASKFQYSVTTEYYAIRNAVSLLDTSPLFKYRFKGPQAIDLLRRCMIRDVQKCKIGRALYTAWCDNGGFVVQDGVIMRVAEDDFWLTSAEPSLRYFRQIARSMGLNGVAIDDVSTQFGILALQGPLSHSVISQVTPDATQLDYFGLTQSKIAECDVVISRTGFTGDLGFEIWVHASDALQVWDAIVEAGAGFNIIPVGTTALKIARVEAGLLLMDVDFQSSRFAWVDEQRETPIELGWAWMLKDLSHDDRDFIGREAIETEIRQASNRWTTVGLEMDWGEFEKVHREAGIPTPKFEHYREETMSIYRRGEKQWDYAGYASSFLFSSLLKKPIAIAKLPPDLTIVGTEVDLEFPVIRKPVTVLARVATMPFYDPDQKTKSLTVGASS